MRPVSLLSLCMLLALVAEVETVNAQVKEAPAIEASFRGGAAKGLPDDVLRHFDRVRDLRGTLQLTAPVGGRLLRLGGYLDFGQRRVREVIPLGVPGWREIWTEKRWVSELGFVMAERLWRGHGASVRAGQQLGYLRSGYRSLGTGRLPLGRPLEAALEPWREPRHWLSVRASLELLVAVWEYAGVVLAVELAYQWQLVETVLPNAREGPDGRSWNVPYARHAIHPSARFGFYFDL